MIGLLWGILGFVLIGVHITFNQLEFLFPAVGAILVALVTSFVPGMDQNLPLQVGIWVAVSFLSLIFFRRKFKKSFQGKEIKDERDEFSGQKATVLEAIAPGKSGRIKFQGTSWTALSETEHLTEGTEVQILEKVGMGFVVTGQDLDEEIKRTGSPHQKDWDQLEKRAKDSLPEKEK